MCGICGIISNESSEQKEILQSMTHTLHHRGPDDEGFEWRHQAGMNVGFGFKRLSIIDLSAAGHQPMIDRQTNHVVVFNGEIYNFMELKKELIGLGHQFSSNSDTEVILKAYAQWGKSCVNRFLGMFAIAIYDPIKAIVIFFRDRVGVKPLYYHLYGDSLLFSSELKAFHQHPSFQKVIHYDVLALYFKMGYIPAPHTIFKNTFKLLPGHLMIYDLEKKDIEIEKYWSVNEAYNKPKSSMSFDEASEELEKLLLSACQYRIIADVPVGIFLSGGYDSSVVAALLSSNSSNKIKTFTIGFHEQSFNEAEYAQKIAQHLGTDHHEYYCTHQDAIELLPEFYTVFDEPFSEAVSIPNILVSKLARKHVKVALSADAGDEIFAGYSRHHKMFLDMIRLNRIPYLLRKLVAESCNRIFKGSIQSLINMDRLGRYCQLFNTRDPFRLFLGSNQSFTNNEIAAFLSKPFIQLSTPFDNHSLLNNEVDLINRILALEHQTYLPDDILHKVDYTSMFTSLEAREPLIDHRILEFVSTLPASYKLHGNTGKYILRNIVHKYIPRQLIERPKKGFGLAIDVWGTRELKPYFDDVMSAENLKHHGFFNDSLVLDLYQHYQKGNPQCFERVWLFISFQMWYNRWILNK